MVGLWHGHTMRASVGVRPATAVVVARAALATLVALAFLCMRAPAALATESVQEDSAPSAEKLTDPVARYVVREESDEQWHTVADWPQQVDIPYRFVGTMPQDLSERSPYAYWLVVEPGAELSVVAGSAQVSLTHADGSVQDVTDALEVGESDTEIYAGSADIRAALPGLAATDTVTLSYAARLTESAKHGFSAGNDSWAHIEYTARPGATSPAASRVPNLASLVARRALADALALSPAVAAADRGEGLAHSPRLQATVYTYRLEITKTDEKGEPLAGARLALRDADGLWYVDDGDWSHNKAKAAMRMTDERGLAAFERIDSEYYEVVELEAPEGYGVIDPVGVRLESGAANGSLTLAANSSRGAVTNVDADGGTVSLRVEDPRASDIPTLATTGGTVSSRAGPALSRLEGLLSRTADAALRVWPAILISVLALLCGLALRRGRGRRNTH